MVVQIQERAVDLPQTKKARLFRQAFHRSFDHIPILSGQHNFVFDNLV